MTNLAYFYMVSVSIKNPHTVISDGPVSVYVFHDTVTYLGGIPFEVREVGRFTHAHRVAVKAYHTPGQEVVGDAICVGPLCCKFGCKIVESEALA